MGIGDFLARERAKNRVEFFDTLPNRIKEIERRLDILEGKEVDEEEDYGLFGFKCYCGCVDWDFIDKGQDVLHRTQYVIRCKHCGQEFDF